MKFKLDENLGTRTQIIFRAAGHDVSTVDNQQLCGCPDSRLYEVCRAEGRCLVTLDLDFGDVTRFPPARGPGVVVLRLPKSPTLEVLESLAASLLKSLGADPLGGQLWIVEPGRIRIHQTEESQPAE